MFARCNHRKVRGAARATLRRTSFPAQDTHGTKAGEHIGSSHGDDELGGMTSPGAPTHRGAPGLRLDGQHTGKVRVPAARLDVAGPALEIKQGGREEEDGRGVLMLGRRCSRGRLGVDGGVA
jgi:hypothetical protein